MTKQPRIRTGAIIAAALAMGAATFPGHAQAQTYGNPDLPCPHGQWLGPRFYTTFPEGTRFIQQDIALCNRLQPDVFGLGCHGMPGGGLAWDNLGGGQTVAPDEFVRRFCMSPGVQASNEGFLFACHGANPGTGGNMWDTAIAKASAASGKPVTGATGYLVVSPEGELTVCNNAAGVRSLTTGHAPTRGVCGNLDSFITSIAYRDRTTGLCNELDSRFVVSPADQLDLFGELCAPRNAGNGTCASTSTPMCSKLIKLPCYGGNRIGVVGLDHGEFLRPQGWMSEAPRCGPRGIPGRVAAVGLLPGCYVQLWEMEKMAKGTPNAKVPPDVLIAMALDAPGTCIGAAMDAASIPFKAIQLQWHTNTQDYCYGNNLPVPPGHQINRGSYCQQQQSWEVLQMMRGTRFVDGNGTIVPRNALRGPGLCGGGNVRANNVDPPYEPGEADDDHDVGGCAATTPGQGASGLAVLAVGAMLAARRRRR